ncbi:MAG: hypothetical protein R3311_21525, partial [Oceanisphaera sp.]|nr:hypothetical protein [Oceanisphaera sp.]
MEELAKPSRPFPDDSFYDLLVAEFAIRRQQYNLALDNYLYQARRTRDLGVTATAARLAQFIKDEQATMEAVDIWLELAPEDRNAHYLAASALAKSRRPIEALPHMIKVLEGGAESNFAALAASVLTLPETQQQAFLEQLNQLLVQHPQDLSLKTA